MATDDPVAAMPPLGAPAGTSSVLLVGDRSRKIPAPRPGSVVLAPAFRARRLAAAGHLVCIAAPNALPLRDGSVHELRLDRSVRSDDLPSAVAECSRALHGSGLFLLETHVRLGLLSWRWLASHLFNTPRPRPPEAIARLLLESGFERIEQLVRGSLGRFRGRRLPGRAWNSSLV
jgi:hypothetical protein